MKTITFIITALLLAVSTSAFASGAIAVASDGSNNNGYAYGLNHDYPDQASAKAAALAKCEENRIKYGIAAACEIVTWYVNGCGAFATASNGANSWAWRDTSGEAGPAAVKNCNDRGGGTSCQLQHVECDGTAK
jgi:hypothetical protein